VEVEQERSFSQSLEESSRSGIAPLYFFHLAFTLFSILFSIFALLSSNSSSLLFIISELRCLLLGISSIGYLLISSLSLVLVPLSG
jgi:hypothetical protein